MKFLRRILPLALAAIALTVAAHSYAVAPPVATEARAYPTEFPLSEPDYTSKRLRDFSPFTDALANFSAERRSALDALVLEATIPKLQQLMASGDLTAEDLVVYYLDRIQRYDINQLNSVMELNPEALTIARNLDAERAEGNLWGPLHGIPVLVKDNITTGDQMHTTAGAYALKDWQGDRDAQLVKNLRNAGAVILGKANLSEWANYVDPAMPSGFSALGGQTRHPYGPFDPLGSSSGSAVSVAANLTAVSVGSETEGSIVRPAATNNIVGLKPTHGLVSGDYVIPLVDWMDVPGPMGRTVTDVATLLGALTHTDEGAEESPDPAVATLQGEDFTRFLDLEQAKQQRVGVVVIPEAAIAEIEALIASPTEDVTPEVLAILPTLLDQYQRASQSANAAIAALTQQGIAVVELDLKTVPQAPDANAALPPGFKASLNAFLPTLPNPPVAALIDVVSFNYADPANRIPYGQDHLTAAQRSDSPSPAYTTLRDTQQTTARTALDQMFAEAGIDVLVASTQAYAAAGYPALTVPIGYAETGEPLGAYLIGPALSEPDLLAVGYAIEQAAQARQAPDLDKTLAIFTNLHHAVARVQ